MTKSSGTQSFYSGECPDKLTACAGETGERVRGFLGGIGSVADPISVFLAPETERSTKIGTTLDDTRANVSDRAKSNFIHLLLSGVLLLNWSNSVRSSLTIQRIERLTYLRGLSVFFEDSEMILIGTIDELICPKLCLHWIRFIQ
jgi:hypothetical protein